jgi:UDP-N-acetylglucosamine 2-epimerase (non-hydrolysing)
LKKILFIFGTRPEAIKMAPVVNIFKQDGAHFETRVVVTAQHREMLDQVLEVFQIEPNFDLDLMAGNQTLESLTGKVLNGISGLFDDYRPDLVFVQGDTTTTFAASLAAFYKKIPVGHIEAGLRTSNRYSPFPEEINRRMTSSIATYHLPPTKQAAQNLLHEGVEKENIKITGNTVIDALFSVSAKLDTEHGKYETFFSNEYDIDLVAKKTILVTGHRRESFGHGFENICYAIKQIAQNNNVQIIYPVHLNPNVQEPVNRILGRVDNVYLIPPQDYVPFVYLMKNAHIILTDSGGVQEEAPSLGKPVLVMRNNTERPEGVAAGTARLVGIDEQEIISTIELLLQNETEYNRMAHAVNPYGDGKASEKIYDFILHQL